MGKLKSTHSDVHPKSLFSKQKDLFFHEGQAATNPGRFAANSIVKGVQGMRVHWSFEMSGS